MGFRLFLDMVPIASLLLIFAFLTVLPYRKEPAAQSLIYFIGLVFFLLLASSGELLAPAGTATLLFAKLEYIPYLYIPVVWLSFCLRYTGWITYTNGKILIVAVVAPALAFLIVITNEWHGLLWQKIVYLESDGLSILRPVHGPLFWLYLVYSWSFNAFGTVLVIRSFFSGQRLYYRQSMWILAGSIIPGITNLLNVASIMPGIAKDFTPIGFALSAVCFLAGIYIHRLLWIGVLHHQDDMHSLTSRLRKHPTSNFQDNLSRLTGCGNRWCCREIVIIYS